MNKLVGSQDVVGKRYREKNAESLRLLTVMVCVQKQTADMPFPDRDVSAAGLHAKAVITHAQLPSKAICYLLCGELDL